MQRVGEPLRGTAGLERLLLAFVGRPAAQIDDLETRRDAPVRRAVAAAVDLLGALQACGAAAAAFRRAAMTLPPPSALISSIRSRGARIDHGEEVGVGHGQREAGALEQAAIVAHIGERRDAGAGAPLRLGLGLDQRPAQLLKRAPAEGRAHEQPVGVQRAPDLDQRAGEIVDAVERQPRDHEAEAGVPERQQILVADDGGPRAECGERRRALGIDHRPDRRQRADFAPEHAVEGAEVERQRKLAQDRLDALGDFGGDAVEQEFVLRQLVGKARAAAAQQACGRTARRPALMIAPSSLFLRPRSRLYHGP